MNTEAQLRTDIRRFVLEDLLLNDTGSMPKDHESFLDTGTIDSTGVLEVVMFLEQTYKFKVLDRELVPENLDSIDRLVDFVQRKTNVA